MNDISILIVDDEEAILRSSRNLLKSEGYSKVADCSDSRKVIDILKAEPIELILLDLSMPYITGEELLNQISEEFHHIAVVVITGHNDLDTAVRCIQMGAHDFIAKPVDPARLLTSVKNACIHVINNRVEVNLKNKIMSTDLENPEHFEKIITQDDNLFGVMRYIEAISKTDYPVLINGQTGTGKDLFAESIHLSSQRKGNYVEVNVNEFDQSFFIDALFGHSKGSFTGAAGERKGMIENAEEGTLFLDEIGDLELSQQVKLLRLIQNKEYRPIGSDEVHKSHARLVFATNKNLKKMVQEGTFRKDLYFRLQAHEVNLPSLKNRNGDISLLIKHFLANYSEEYNRKTPIPDEASIQLFESIDYDGNIRELQQLVLDILITYKDGESFYEHASSYLKNKKDIFEELDQTNFEDTLVFPKNLPTLKEISTLCIEEAINRSKGNKSKAAKLLGITPSALSQRLNKSE